MELPGLREPHPRPEEARVSPGGVPLEGSRGCSRSATCPSQLLSTLVRPRNLDHDTWWILPRKFPRAPLSCPVGLSKKKPGAHPGGQPTSTHPDLQRRGIDRGNEGKSSTGLDDGIFDRGMKRRALQNSASVLACFARPRVQPSPLPTQESPCSAKPSPQS